MGGDPCGNTYKYASVTWDCVWQILVISTFYLPNKADACKCIQINNNVVSLVLFSFGMIDEARCHTSQNIQLPSILIKHESCGMCVCPRFSQPPKVWGSWNIGSRPNLAQHKTWRSPIFEILIFKGVGGWPYGPELKRMGFSCFLCAFFLENLSHFNT